MSGKNYYKKPEFRAKKSSSTESSCSSSGKSEANMADQVITINEDNITEDIKIDKEADENLQSEDLAELKKEHANRLYTAKQYKQALVYYTEAVELCPSVPRYYSNRAACYMMLLQYRDALNDAKKCLELDPKFIKAYSRVIKCSLMLGDIVEAETAINKLEKEIKGVNSKELIQTELNDLLKVKQFLKESAIAYTKKDYRKVVYCMDRCIEVSSFCPKFKITKAECLAHLKRYQEAEMLANDVLHANKQNADAIYVRGICLYYQDNIDNAFKHFQQVLRLAPDHSKALNSYKRAKNLKSKKEEGNAAFKAERYQDAYKLYTEALQIDPENTMTNAKLHFNKATVSAKLGNLKESVTECNKAIQLDDNYLKAILRRAASFMELQEFEEAVRDYEKACKIDKSRDNKRLLMEAKTALKKSKRKDYYKILGIEKTASTDDIKKAYRKRALVHHPDRHSNAEELEKREQEKKFKEVGEAYSILSDPKKRSRYDSGQDMDESDFNLYDMDVHDRFQAFFDTTSYAGCRSFGFEFI